MATINLLYFLLVIGGVSVALLADLFFRADHLLLGLLCYCLDGILVYYLFRQNNSLSLAVILWESCFILGGLLVSFLYLHESFSPRKALAAVLAFIAVLIIYGNSN